MEVFGREKMSFRYAPGGLINNKSALVQIMAKFGSLFQTLLAYLLPHISVTRLPAIVCDQHIYAPSWLPHT